MCFKVIHCSTFLVFQTGLHNLGHGVLGSGIAMQATTAHLDVEENDVASAALASVLAVYCICILYIIFVVHLFWLLNKLCYVFL